MSAPTGAVLDPIMLVHPELRDAALRMREFTGRFTPMSLDKLALRRSLINGLGAAPRDDIRHERRIVPGMAGQPDVEIYVVNARTGGAAPAIVHMHGGGFTASSARASLPAMQEMAKALDCVIVTVEFRLAPETSFAGSLEDNYAALLWLHRHAAELGVDPARIAIMGESGGGGHAALLAIAARDRGEVPLIFQALTYPMLDDRTGSSRRVPAHIGYFGWNVENNRFGWHAFLGQAPGGDDVPAHGVPARVEDLSGLPPTFIGVGTLDLFVEENLDYARRLINAGVPTELVVVPGAFHGFDSLGPTSSPSRRFVAGRLQSLRRALYPDHQA